MKDKSEIAGVLAQIHMKMPNAWNGNDNLTPAPILGFSSSIDFNNAQLQVAGVDQGGFAMGGKDFYLSDNEHLAEVRGKYVEHVQRILTLAGGMTPRPGQTRQRWCGWRRPWPRPPWIQ